MSKGRREAGPAWWFLAIKDTQEGKCQEDWPNECGLLQSFRNQDLNPQELLKLYLTTYLPSKLP